VKCRRHLLASPQPTHRDEETQEDGPSRYLRETRETCAKSGRGRTFHIHESRLSYSVTLRGISLRRKPDLADWGRMKVQWVQRSGIVALGPIPSDHGQLA